MDRCEKQSAVECNISERWSIYLLSMLVMLELSRFCLNKYSTPQETRIVMSSWLILTNWKVKLHFGPPSFGLKKSKKSSSWFGRPIVWFELGSVASWSGRPLVQFALGSVGPFNFFKSFRAESKYSNSLSSKKSSHSDFSSDYHSASYPSPCIRPITEGAHSVLLKQPCIIAITHTLGIAVVAQHCSRP